MFRWSLFAASLLVCTFPLILPASAQGLTPEQGKSIALQAEVAKLKTVRNKKKKNNKAKKARRRRPRPALQADCNPNAKRNPVDGPFFENEVPNPLSPGFKYQFGTGNRITVSVAEAIHDPGFNGCDGTTAAKTKIYGYGVNGVHTWPGKTFEVKRGVRYDVTWENKILPGKYILTGADGGEGLNFTDFPVVDKTLHWAYSLFEGGSPPTLEDDGVPIVTHLHGGHSDVEYDGNPEFFYNHDLSVLGPQFQTTTYTYRNNFEAAGLLYHDHALGLTRLNVYAGLAGLYFVRDPSGDTGKYPNSMNLPVFPYEVGLAVQDRMFKNNGELLYPAFPGEPGYDDFITSKGINLDPSQFPNCGPVDGVPPCGPTVLTEFFGDHMVVNGKVWPKMDVEPRQYHLRLLNGCDSRFLVLQFIQANAEGLGPADGVTALDFYVIGADQGFKTKGSDQVAAQSKLLLGPGERYDVIIDFKPAEPAENYRVLMWNSGGDAPFGGLPAGETSIETSRVMAFDVVTALSSEQTEPFDIDVFNANLQRFGHSKVEGQPSRTRRVGLFEGTDDKGRLQPLLGTAEPATDSGGNPITWPAETEYADVGLSGQVEGTVAWHTQPSTENPKKESTEIWEIWNLTPDAHPIHLHLVFFEVLSRHRITFDPIADADGMCQPQGVLPTTGVCLETQHLVEHDGAIGEGRIIKFPAGGCDTPECYGPELAGTGYTDIGYPKEIVTANPGEVTVIKAKFQKTGPFVWHCHILSHEDHEMMRVMYVGDQSGVGRNLRGS